MKILLNLFLMLTFLGSAENCLSEPVYPWMDKYDTADTIANQIPLPPGYERVQVQRNSFGDWLRCLPLKKGKPPVYLHNGEKKYNQSAHVAVVSIDVGGKDLQQCADAVIRLRAEYLYSEAEYEAIHFNFTSGDNASLKKWQQGWRPLIRGNNVRWQKSRNPDFSYAGFREYLNTVFMYAGTYSLSRELQSVNIRDMQMGDVFIQGGFPGHAVIVADMAANRKTGEKVFLLAQSYMPAQDIHILRNPANEKLSPWYESDFGETLQTPEWTFGKHHLRRFSRVSGEIPTGLKRLLKAYPEYLSSAGPNVLRWKDGTEMIFDDGIRHKDFQTLMSSPDLEDQTAMPYPAGLHYEIPRKNSDPGRIRYEPFFLKMYGDSPPAVRANLTTLSWLPRTVGRHIQITTVNGVHGKLRNISDELDMLPPHLTKHLSSIGGTFNWRKISGTQRLSPHSFGIAIDINVKYADYWRWSRPPLNYKNRIPLEIVGIFEKCGFIWGGKWYHYDTMHFEYRPELLVN